MVTGDGPPIRIRVSACLTDGDRILLVQHHKRERRYWLLPGGGVERGERLTAALQRELVEETGLQIEVGRLLIVCEVLEPGGRHIVNLVFRGTVAGGELRVGRDGVVVDVRWHERGCLRELVTHPYILDEVLACWDEGFEGPVRFLGNVWRAL